MMELYIGLLQAYVAAGLPPMIAAPLALMQAVLAFYRPA